MCFGTRSYNIAKKLVERGHSVDLLTLDRDCTISAPGRWAITTVDGVRVHWLGVKYSNAMTFRERMRVFARYAAEASCRLVSLDGDVVYSTSTPLSVAIPGLLAARTKRIPHVFEVRDLWPQIPFAVGALRNVFAVQAALALEKAAYFGSQRVIALSPEMRDGIMRTGYPSHRIDVIPNMCDIDLFSVHPNHLLELRSRHSFFAGRRVVLYAGSLGFINNPNYLVDLALHLQEIDPEILVLAVGDGKLRESMLSYARQRDVLGKSFCWVSSISKREIAPYFGAADLVLSIFANEPLMSSNSANKFFDGLAAGRPVVVNYGGWQAKRLQEMKCGMQIPGDDARVGAERIGKALHDPVWMETARSGALRLRNEFDVNALTDQVAATLEYTAKSVPPRTG
jgi:glycosyltransferase involved in cell wall biosynthesis